jgi:hypothetical protein
MPECDFVGAQFTASDIQGKDGRNELRPYIQNPFCVICAFCGHSSALENELRFAFAAVSAYIASPMTRPLIALALAL